MKLLNIAVATGVARPGMTVREVFAECVRRNVPGIPFEGTPGHITGKVSVRHVLKESCLPDYMVKHAHLLGDHIDCLMIPEAKARSLLALPVDSFVFPSFTAVTSESPVIKALAVMEEADTTYVFVVDSDGYKGIVTNLGVAQRMLQLEAETQWKL